MKFPASFTRTMGGTNTLGTDAVPSGAPSGADNQLQMPIRDGLGYPVHRVAVTYLPPDTAIVPLQANLFFWEETTQAWYKLNVEPKYLVPNVATYFDVIAPQDAAVTSANLTNGYRPGSIEVVLIVNANAAASAGVHTFAMSGDLTTIGEEEPDINAPTPRVRAVTPSDTADLPDGPCKKLFVVTTGNLTCIAREDPDGGGTSWGTVTAGSIIPVQARRVKAATTAVVLALY